jgi:hypothetical protein
VGIRSTFSKRSIGGMALTVHATRIQYWKGPPNFPRAEERWPFANTELVRSRLATTIEALAVVDGSDPTKLKTLCLTHHARHYKRPEFAT